MSALARNFAKQFSDDTLSKFKDFTCEKIFTFAGKNEVVTVKKYIYGSFNKHANNTGDILLKGNSQDIVEKAECFVHLTYVKSGENLMVLDKQRNESTLTDLEIATKTLFDEK